MNQTFLDLNEGDIVRFRETMPKYGIHVGEAGIVTQASFTFYRVQVGNPAEQRSTTVLIEDSGKLLRKVQDADPTIDPRVFWDKHWQEFPREMLYSVIEAAYTSMLAELKAQTNLMDGSLYLNTLIAEGQVGLEALQQLKKLLAEVRNQLQKYGDEITYQLDSGMHIDEGLAEWEEDERQLDEVMAQFASFLV